MSLEKWRLAEVNSLQHGWLLIFNTCFRNLSEAVQSRPRMVKSLGLEFGTKRIT